MELESIEVYENDQVTSDVDSEEQFEPENLNREIGSFKPVEKSHLSQDKIREIVVPVSNATNGKILRYASELARTFSARIALVYNVPPLTLSEDFLEYSRIENYKDFFSDHIQSTGESALAKISSRLQQEGIEFRKIITCSDQEKVLDEILNGSNTQTIAVVLSAGRKNSLSAKLGLLKGLPATVILKSKVPVFIIP